MRHSHTGTSFRMLLAAAGLAALLLLLVVPVQQRVFRWRAQRLQADVLRLQLQPGTFADLERMERRWGAHAKYSGTCTAAHCVYVIGLLTPGSGNWDDWWRSHPRRYRLFSWLGGRDAKAMVTLHATDNILWGADFNLIVDTSARGEPEANPLVADLMTAPHLLVGEPHLDDKALTLGYEVRRPPGYCSGCVLGWVRTTWQTPLSTRRRLLRVNLDCITRWQPCTTEQDILPVIADEHDFEGGEGPGPCASVETRAREADNLVLAEVTRARHVVDGLGGALLFDVRVLERLKRAAEQPVGSAQTFAAEPELPEGAAIQPGKRYFFLFHDLNHDPGALKNRTLQSEVCSIVPAEGANDAEVRAGNALDWSRGEPFWGREFVTFP